MMDTPGVLDTRPFKSRAFPFSARYGFNTVHRFLLDRGAHDARCPPRHPRLRLGVQGHNATILFDDFARLLQRFVPTKLNVAQRIRTLRLGDEVGKRSIDGGGKRPVVLKAIPRIQIGRSLLATVMPLSFGRMRMRP